MDDSLKLDHLNLESYEHNDLNVRCFAMMLNKTTQCYKFYWLEAIVELLPDKNEITYAEIVDEMLWDAWFTVTKYHLRLGPIIEGKSENNIEHAIHLIENDPEVVQPMRKNLLFSIIEKDRGLLKNDYKKIETYVPYRLLSPFVDLKGGDPRWDSNKSKLIKYINGYDGLPYYIVKNSSGDYSIRVDKKWRRFILDNSVIIKSWIQMNKIKYLQQRNPGVPGIVYKLEDEKTERRLEKVRNLWVTYSDVTRRPLKDIYCDKEIGKNCLSLDHFIPWSYIANDELWDLIPMLRTLNSSKGNKLPKWEKFFKLLVKEQYGLFCAVCNNTELKKDFEECRKDNLNTLWSTEQLYIPSNTEEQFANIFEENMKPIYDSAYLQGYDIWNI